MCLTLKGSSCICGETEKLKNELLKLYHVLRKPSVNVSWWNISQRWQGGHQGQQSHFRRYSMIKLQARPQRRRGNRARALLPRPQGNGRPAPGPNRRACPGSPKGMISEGMAVSRATQGAVRDPDGSRGVGYVATKALRTPAEGSAGVSKAVPLWQPYGCSTACALRRGASWLSNTKTSAQPAKRQQRRPVYPTSARTRGGTAPLFLWPPRHWRIDYGESRFRDAIGCNTQSLNEAGRGGASSGRNTTTRLFQGRQAPSLTFLLFVYSLLFSAAYRVACTRL